MFNDDLGTGALQIFYFSLLIYQNVMVHLKCFLVTLNFEIGC